MAKKRPAGDGMIRRRDDKRWEGRIVIGHKKDGSPLHKSVFAKTQKEVLELLHQTIEMYRDAELTEDSRMTVSEWLDEWLNHRIIFSVREGTWEAYRYMINNQVKPYIGGVRLSFITTADIQRFYNKIKKDGRVNAHPIHGYQLADSMVRKVHMMLHKAFKAAVQEHLLVRNPTEGTTVPKNNCQEKQILNDEQLERFMLAIKEEPYWHNFFYTELMTGLRRGELCGLKWTDVNFEQGVLRVRRSVSKKRGGGVVEGETKTGAGMRTIQLPPSVLDLLQRRKEATYDIWVFPQLHNPSKAMNPETAYKKLKVILKNADLPLIRFHDLRHTFATHAMKGGVDAKTLAGILGHTNASFTLDTYTHVTTDMQKNASLVVGKMMQNFMIRK